MEIGIAHLFNTTCSCWHRSASIRQGVLKMSDADHLVKGAVLGMIASAAAVAAIHFVVEVGTRWNASGLNVTLVTALAMALLLLVPPLVAAWRNRADVVDPFFEPAAVKPLLQGRTVGIVLGIVFGISVVTGWQ
ncbi:hypothetical protein [Burkholderia sp. AU15512]|uniref:hypothetical protein n=2 Tax=unclassified Burkholderia TaxID=2613784 RepID=UPI00211B3752|nr:hypothetical protein [Burkholderia sp. AU15512]